MLYNNFNPKEIWRSLNKCHTFQSLTWSTTYDTHTYTHTHHIYLNTRWPQTSPFNTPNPLLMRLKNKKGKHTDNSNWRLYIYQSNIFLQLQVNGSFQSTCYCSFHMCIAQNTLNRDCIRILIFLWLPSSIYITDWLSVNKIPLTNT
jgi:hypothetical protein